MSSNSSTVKLTREPGRSASEANSAISTNHAVRYVLSSLDEPSVRERRVQAILFIAEANWYDSDESPPPLLNTTFEKIRRGVFSPDIRKAIEDLDLRSRPSFKSGLRTKVYDISRVDPPNEIQGENPQKAKKYLDAVIKKSKNTSGDELMSLCLDFDEVQSLTSGEKVRFEKK